ncbi:MAG: DUF4115 domain-containing protein [Syntrophobacterales bacterium]|nr:DUF4115 domain-containing protein [Syntrophobacterales bacterium]
MSIEQNWESPKEVGLYLKRCREEKEISLLDISEATKISPQLLRAIEEGQWEKLYSSFFLVSFLKAYCKVVGIPCEKAVKSAERFFIPIEKRKTESYRRLLARRGPLLPNRGKIIFYTVVIAISILMLFGGVFLSNYTTKPLENVTTNRLENHPDLPQEVVKVFNIPQTSSQSGDGLTSPRETSKEVTRPSSFNAPTSEKEQQNRVVEAGVSLSVHRLIIEAIGETWVRVWVDDRGTPTSRLMTDGERIEFEVKEKAKVQLGNAAGAKIIWDDQVFERLGRKGRVVTLSFPKPKKTSKNYAP